MWVGKGGGAYGGDGAVGVYAGDGGFGVGSCDGAGGFNDGSLVGAVEGALGGDGLEKEGSSFGCGGVDFQEIAPG